MATRATCSILDDSTMVMKHVLDTEELLFNEMVKEKKILKLHEKYTKLSDTSIYL